MRNEQQFQAIPGYIKIAILAISATAGIASFVLSLSILMQQGTSGVEVVSNTLFCVASELTKIVSGFLFALAGLMGWQKVRNVTMTVFILTACFSIYLSFAFFKNQDAKANSQALQSDYKFKDLQSVSGTLSTQIDQKAAELAALTKSYNAIDPMIYGPGNTKKAKAAMEAAAAELEALKAQRVDVSGRVQTFGTASGSAMSPAYTTIAKIFHTTPEDVSGAFSFIMALILEAILFAAGQFGFFLWKLRNDHVFGDNGDYEVQTIPVQDLKQEADGRLSAKPFNPGFNPVPMTAKRAGFNSDYWNTTTTGYDPGNDPETPENPVTDPEFQPITARQAGFLSNDFQTESTQPYTVPYTQPCTHSEKPKGKGLGNGICEHCGNTYKKQVLWQRFCSENCRLAYHDFSPTKRKKRVGK